MPRMAGLVKLHRSDGQPGNGNYGPTAVKRRELGPTMLTVTSSIWGTLRRHLADCGPYICFPRITGRGRQSDPWRFGKDHGAECHHLQN